MFAGRTVAVMIQVGCLASATVSGASTLTTTPGPAGSVISYRAGAPSFAAQPKVAHELAGKSRSFRLEVPGLRMLAEPGMPALAGTTVLLALPPRATPILELSDAAMHEVANVFIAPPEATPIRDEVDDVAGAVAADAPGASAEIQFRAVADAEIYATDAWWPPSPVSILSRGVVRDTDYVLVQVIPFQWNPVRRILRVYDHLDVQVRFAPAELKGVEREPSPPPGASGVAVAGSLATSTGERVRAGSETREREEGAELVFANGPVPASWRRRRAATGMPRILQNLNPDASGEAWKIEVSADGLYRVRQSELVAAGFPASEDPKRLRLQLDGKPIAILPRDLNNNGLFDGGDELLFYGLANPGRFTTVHVYWLTRAGGGKFMSVEAALPAVSASYPILPSWPSVNRMEKNELYQDGSPVDPAAGDPWFYTETIRTTVPGCAVCFGSGPCGFSEPLTLLPLAPAETGRAYEVRGRLFAKRLSGACAAEQQATRVSVNGTVVGTATWTTSGGQIGEFSFPLLPSLLLAPPAVNTIELDTDTALAPGAHKTYIDYVEIDAPARFLASADRLEARGSWPNGGLIHGAGFSERELDIVDLRGDGSAALLVGYKLISLGPSMPLTAVFAIPPGFGGAASHRVVAYGRSRLLAVSSIVKDTPSTLTTSADGTVHMVIAHPAFVPSATQLASYRTGTGLRSTAFDVTDIYDEFSWGQVDPQGIRDFIAHAFSSWTPQPLYVLLVGDSSYDFKNYFGLSQPGYPPASFLPYREYMSALPNNIEQILGSDFFFQEMTGDDLPDLLLGRLATRSAVEVDTYRAKLAAYEARSGQEAWNGRYILISDDDIADAFPCPATSQPPITEVEVFMRDAVSRHLAAAGPDAVQIEERDYWNNNIRGRQVILDERNVGASLFIYFGHGSLSTFGTNVCSGNFFFRDGDLPFLTNTVALPISAAVSCNVGAFHFTSASGGGVRCSGETFTLADDAGDIAFLGSTTLISFPGGKGEIEGLLDGLFASGSTFLPPFLPAADAARRAGGIHYAAQYGFFTNPRVSLPYQTDNQRTLVLHGDPAAKLLIQNP